MRTMLLQWLFAMLAAVCAGAAFRLSARPSGEAEHRTAWRLVAWCLALFAGIALVMNAWGSWAMLAGGQSGVMRDYLRWAPAFNHSRSSLWLACCALLTAMAFYRSLSDDRFAGLRVAVLLAGAAVGAGLGAVEGTLIPASHFTRVALGDTVELFAVMATLLVTLVRGSIDRYLWTLLTAFGAMVAINILWLAALSLVDDTRVWSPSPFAMAIYRAALMALMCAVAIQRLRAAGRGQRVGSMIADSRGVPTTMAS